MRVGTPNCRLGVKIHSSMVLISLKHRHREIQLGWRNTDLRLINRFQDLCRSHTYHTIDAWRKRMCSSILQSWACHSIQLSPIVRGVFALLGNYSCRGNKLILVARDLVRMLSVPEVGDSEKREDIRWPGA